MNTQTWVKVLLLGNAFYSFSAYSQNDMAQTTTQSDSLPVYQVMQQGATDEQIKKLSKSLKLPLKSLGVKNGMVSLTDLGQYLTIPVSQVNDRAVKRKLLDSTKGYRRH